MQLDQIKTVEVERWLLATEAANGTQAKIKCVMSALFSHAVRWEFCGHNPISSGIPVGSGAKRGPSTGVGVSSNRRRSPLKLTAEQVALVLTELGSTVQIGTGSARSVASAQSQISSAQRRRQWWFLTALREKLCSYLL
jgi:hypothetical protein